MINREKYADLRVLSLEEIIDITETEGFDPDTDGFLFGVEFAKESWTLAKFKDRPSVFKFDDPVQRGDDVWSDRKRSEGIASILMNIELGPIKAQKKSINKTLYRNVIDGGNRLTSQRDFIKNLWSLSSETYIFGQIQEERVLIDLSGAFFKDLPEMFRNRITGYDFEVHIYDMDDEMKAEMYYRWNNYEAHTSSELKRSHMSAIMQKTINDAMTMDFARIGFKEIPIKRSLHMEPLLQGIALIETNNNTKLNQETINELLERNKFSPQTVLVFSKIASFLEAVFEIYEGTTSAKKIFHKKHKSTLIYIASHGLDSDVESFAKWAKQFFITEIEESDYNKFGGDARLIKVQTRNQIALKHFQDYVSALSN